ncbi:MAG: unnamed protein product [uncultured Caballeronia sp.]|nr:MAG: unnamed protein product [uncultured Caballeronia sp.]
MDQHQVLPEPAEGQFAAALHRVTDVLERIMEPQGQGPVHPVGPEGEDRALERFQRFAPPKFYGGADPEVAETWLERMLDIFAALEYTGERQVSFAVFQFEGPARAWWNMIRAR